MPGNALDQFAVEQIYDLITIRIRPVAGDKENDSEKREIRGKSEGKSGVCVPAAPKQMANNVII